MRLIQIALTCSNAPKRGRRGTEREEDQREAEHEQQRVNERRAPRLLDVVEVIPVMNVT